MFKHPVAAFIDDRFFVDFQKFKPPTDADPLWAFNEFSRADLNDQRLTLRLQMLGHQFARQPMASIPQACGGWANSKAAYRFCSNEKVCFDAILAAHYHCTVERVGLSSCPVILCPQDTTTLNYMAHPATQGLGHVGTKPGKSLGMLLHSTLAVSPQGQFFGLLHAHCWSRSKPKKKGRRPSRCKEKIKDKESFRWLESFRHVNQLAAAHPHHRWVSVEDREGDIYPVLQEALAPGSRAGLLVRARHDRALLGKPAKKLFGYMRQLSEAGTWTTRVPRQEDQPAREVTLSIRFSKVTFCAPRHRSGQPPLSLWAVWAQEIDPPAGQKPICWCLLTTVPVGTLAQAIERLQWYTRRWIIEEFHRVLKSGCQVEARQLTTRVRLQRALAIDMVVAWRVINLTKAVRLEPDSPADRWLHTQEWQALYCYVHQCSKPPQKPPTIGEAVGWIAQLGGFLARKSDGRPGSTTIARGLQRLNDIVRSWQAFGPDPCNRPDVNLRPKKTTKTCG
jgi:hypothetical protein